MRRKSVQLRKKAQLTIPSDIIEGLNLHEGDQLDKEQAWFWKESWQKGEIQAERDLKEGRLTDIVSREQLDTFFESLGVQEEADK